MEQFWRGRHDENGIDTVMRDSLIVVVPIALTCAIVFLLWFFG